MEKFSETASNGPDGPKKPDNSHRDRSTLNELVIPVPFSTRPPTTNENAETTLPHHDTKFKRIASPGTGVIMSEGEQTAVPNDVQAASELEAGDTQIEMSLFETTHTTLKQIARSSYVNILLVFVPIGIAAHGAHLSAGIVFAMNAAAIIPLAGLLSYATESIAHQMGDAVGALMNISFGNAVEMIIFIALTKNEIRIVQAALLGSILANLLLILGMCFLLGGLRYREQIYNSSVSQMSACLLSLSVMSLLLPTAFYATFNESSRRKAEQSVLKVSHGTSVILLIVYLMYLLFQLKSHSYMYQSTPQHVLDEELAPGPVAAWIGTTSSSNTTSESSSSSSMDENISRKKKLIRKVIRTPYRRRSSGSSVSSPCAETDVLGHAQSNASDGDQCNRQGESLHSGHFRLPTLELSEHDFEGNPKPRSDQSRENDRVNSKNEGLNCGLEVDQDFHQGPNKSTCSQKNPDETTNAPGVETDVDEKAEAPQIDPVSNTLSFVRSISNLRHHFPIISKNVFTQDQLETMPNRIAIPVPPVRYGVRRTNSLPTRLDVAGAAQPHNLSVGNLTMLPNSVTISRPQLASIYISRKSAIILLLVSTALVALCADFLVESIEEVTAGDSGINKVFIGLIILPLVGNAAEHFVAVNVALRNKMDLAIGVAVGSSIQIALFITPFIVLLGWCMGKEMTLYFTLFETVSLFAAALVANFMILDGRSNYLEGSLLCASYIIIAVAAAFYPQENEQSHLGGNSKAAN